MLTTTLAIRAVLALLLSAASLSALLNDPAAALPETAAAAASRSDIQDGDRMPSTTRRLAIQGNDVLYCRL